MSNIRTRTLGRSRFWLGPAMLVSTVLIGIWFVSFVVGIGDRTERDRMLSLARSVAAGVESAQVQALHGDSSDVETSQFDALRAQLPRARDANPDFRFVYLMRPSPDEPDKMIFLVDAEAAQSPDYSAPGDLYDGFSDDLWQVWHTVDAVVQPAYSDDWGRWVTAIAPVQGTDGGMVAVLGIDIRADAWQAALARYRNFAVAIVILVLLLELMFLYGLRRQRASARHLRVLNTRLSGQLEELRLAQAGLHLADVVVLHTGEAIVLLDASLRVIRVNPAFTRITGYSPAQVLGNLTPLFDPDDDDVLRRIRRQLYETAHWSGTLWGVHAGGAKFPMEGSVDLVRDTNGEVLQYVVVFRDVTEQKRLEDRLRELSVTDALTGLPNRRCFDETLEREWQQGIRLHKSLSLVMIDIDHFKAFNDLYGHPAGDRVLRQVATALLSVVSHKGATLARYGGEEFAVILPDCDANCAHVLAETLRRTVAELGIVHHGNPNAPHLTISLGTATRQPPGDTGFDGLLLSADRALYSAKDRGRDSVVAA